MACANGNLAMVKLLLESKANPNALRWDGETTLMAAVNAGNVELVMAAIDRGVNVNAAESRMGQTALMRAVADGRTEIARVLVAAGASVNATSKNSFSPLLFAAQRGDAASVKLLLEAKADPQSKPPAGFGVLRGPLPQPRGCRPGTARNRRRYQRPR